MAELLMELDKTGRMISHRSLPRLLAAEVFAYMDSHEQEEFLGISPTNRPGTSKNLAPDDRRRSSWFPNRSHPAL